MHTRAARMDQGSVDIEKQKALCLDCHPERGPALSDSRMDRGVPLYHARVCHEIAQTQRLGPCIIRTAIMLPRNTSRRIAKPIKIPLRTGSLCCLWRRNGETLVNSAGTALNSAGLALISSSRGSGRD